MAEAELVRPAEYARRRDISRQYVSREIRKGRFPVMAGGWLDVAAVDAIRAATADPSRGPGGRPSMPGPAADPPPQGQAPPAARPAPPEQSQYHQARTVEAVVRAKQSELRYRKEAGELIDKAETYADQFVKARRVRDAIMGIVPVIAHRLVGLTDVGDVRRELAEALRGALARTSNGIRGHDGGPDRTTAAGEAGGADDGF